MFVIKVCTFSALLVRRSDTGFHMHLVFIIHFIRFILFSLYILLGFYVISSRIFSVPVDQCHSLLTRIISVVQKPGCLFTRVTINWIFGSYKINFWHKKLLTIFLVWCYLICGFLVRTSAKVPTQNDGVEMAELEAPPIPPCLF